MITGSVTAIAFEIRESEKASKAITLNHHFLVSENFRYVISASKRKTCKAHLFVLQSMFQLHVHGVNAEEQCRKACCFNSSVAE